MILRDKSTHQFITAYIIDKSPNTVLMLSRGGKRIELRKPWYNDSNRKVFYGLYGKYYWYNFEVIENMYYDIIKYYSV